MHSKRLFTLALGLALALALIGGVALLTRQVVAQERSPAAPSAPQAALGTAFTYQGRLQDGSGPVNDTCDFQFNLYDDDWLSPSLVAGPVDRGAVTVSDGYFSTSIDFGASAFTGEGRQLEILVRCPAGSGSYTTLSGMVTLGANPYALSLRPGAVINGSVELGPVVKAENTYSGMLISYGLHGVSQATGVLGTGGNTGVQGETASTSGTGVYGYATAGSGANYGVYGKTDSPDGWAVYADGRGYVDDDLYVNGALESDGDFHALSNAEVDGDVTVHGNLTWDAETSYVAVAAAAFHPMEDGYDYNNRGHDLWNVDNYSDHYVALVQLPHGATVTKLTFYWWDGSSDDGHCTLYRTDLAGSEVVMAEAWTSGDASTSDSSQDTIIAYATVDNSQYAYYLYWNLPTAVVAGHGVVIEYTFTGLY